MMAMAVMVIITVTGMVTVRVTAPVTGAMITVR